MGTWKDKRLSRLSEKDMVRDVSKVGSGFGKNVSHWLDRDLAYPTNVLYMATECANRNHSAPFPVPLPSWFIQLFTKEEDVVLDPFMGAGTTAIACLNLNRHYVGIELKQKYFDMSVEVTEAIKGEKPNWKQVILA